MNSEEIKTLIKRRRRQILVHSCLYYRFNENLISDYQYDVWGRELAKLQLKHPELSSQVLDYNNEFAHYTPECTSGYQLPIHNAEIVAKAEQLLRITERLK